MRTINIYRFVLQQIPPYHHPTLLLTDENLMGRHQVSQFTFNIKHGHLSLLCNKAKQYQVQLRFAKYDHSTDSVIDDQFPSNIYVRINNKIPILPVCSIILYIIFIRDCSINNLDWRYFEVRK